MRPRACSIALFAIACMLASPLACGVTLARQAVANPTEVSVDLLRRAVTPQTDGSHLPLLFALRQLRDPALAPLFHNLIKRGDWHMQVHAALGLAEIADTRRIDPWLITQVAPQAQESIIASALDLGLLPAEDLGRVLEYDQLHSMARLFAHAERHALGQPPDAGDLQRLSGADDLHIAAMASALLAQSGSSEAFATLQQRLGAAAQRDRDAVTIWLFDAARRYKLTALAPWIERALAEHSNEPERAYRGIFALLMLDPQAGLRAWRTHLGSDPSFSRRVRFGTMLLTCGRHAPPDAYDALLPIGEDEALIARIVDAGKAISSGADASAPLIALLDLGHTRTGLWALDHLREMPAEQSRRVYQHLIDRMREPQDRWIEGAAHAAQAAARLFEIDPDAALERLRAAEDDSPLQQAILLGLFEADSPRAGEAAASLPRIGAGRADSLALILIARHAQSLDEVQTRQLGMIAAGGSRLPDTLQIHAAWLYLKHTKQIDQTLAAVLSPEEVKR